MDLRKAPAVAPAAQPAAPSSRRIADGAKNLRPPRHRGASQAQFFERQRGRDAGEGAGSARAAARPFSGD